MEREIGEVFMYNGNQYVVCAEERDCDGCVFDDYDCIPMSEIRGTCGAHSRKDEQGVIFKRYTLKT